MMFPDSDALMADLSKSTPQRLRQLNKAVAQLVDGYGMVSFSPMDVSDEDRCGAASSRLSVRGHCPLLEGFRLSSSGDAGRMKAELDCPPTCCTVWPCSMLCKGICTSAGVS